MCLSSLRFFDAFSEMEVQNSEINTALIKVLKFCKWGTTLFKLSAEIRLLKPTDILKFQEHISN
jgi:hypothetical protein